MIWNVFLIAETIILIPFLVSRLRDPEFNKRGQEMAQASGVKLIWMGALAGALFSSIGLSALGFEAWISIWKVILHVANVSLLIYLFFISDFENPYARLFRRAKE